MIKRLPILAFTAVSVMSGLFVIGFLSIVKKIDEDNEIYDKDSEYFWE